MVRLPPEAQDLEFLTHERHPCLGWLLKLFSELSLFRFELTQMIFCRLRNRSPSKEQVSHEQTAQYFVFLRSADFELYLF